MKLIQNMIVDMTVSVINKKNSRKMGKSFLKAFTHSLLVLTILSLLLSSCRCETSKDSLIEPSISFLPAERTIESLRSAFPPLTEEEANSPFGNELKIALLFGKELDLYRAVTAFKRALILCPKENKKRIEQIEYSIIECYYLALKYHEVIESFEKSCLTRVNATFPPFGQLLTILYDSYLQIGSFEKAAQVLDFIEKGNREVYEGLILYKAIKEADFPKMTKIEIEGIELKKNFLLPYKFEKKSVQKAKFLNALIPGLGYSYVGQKKSAVTAFIINSLFTVAAYQFFSRGYFAAGLITASFEAGWYFGGINGAGLEAKEYNERLYENKARDFMTKERIFPILSFETVF